MQKSSNPPFRIFEQDYIDIYTIGIPRPKTAPTALLRFPSREADIVVTKKPRSPKPWRCDY